jgi:outer membrane receptor protein involved in Fe transport
VYPFNNGINKGAIKTALGNQNLKWENTSQLDFGLDISLFKSRISLTADY